MYHGKTAGGLEIIINPAHVAAATCNDDRVSVELVTGKTYNFPTSTWPEICAALNVAIPENGNTDTQTAPAPKTFKPLFG